MYRNKLELIKKKIYSQNNYDFFKVELKQEIEKKILKHQYIHLTNLINIFNKNNTKCALDFSNTGTGKTYTTIALCKQLNLNPIIICPKSVICYWKEVCNFYNVKAHTIINYESFKNGNEYDDNMKKCKSDIIEYDETSKKFIWKNIDKQKYIIIYDEAHKCKSEKTLNGQLLFSSKNVCRILLLSATIAQNYNDFKIFGYMLGLYKDIRSGKSWIQQIIRYESLKMDDGDTELMKRIYPDYGSKMVNDNISIENKIFTKCYTIDKKDCEFIESAYDSIKLKLTNHVKMRQRIEEIKVPIVINLVDKYLDCGRSVVVFVNYLHTLKELIKYYNSNNIKCCHVNGEQTVEQRQENITLFQSNEVKIIFCMIQAGSESISLHDTSGNHPRTTLILPSYSGKELIQSLGRVYRSGVQSDVEQYIIFCDTPIERNVSDKLNNKLKFINNFMETSDINFNFDDLLN